MNKEINLSPETREALQGALICRNRRKAEKANKKIRKALIDSGMYQWQLADLIGCSAWSLSAKLRHELPEEEQQHILQLIKDEAERL